MIKRPNHAVVIGASVTGMLAARILSESFTKVSILERDTLPAIPEFRKGVSQSHHGQKEGHEMSS